MRKVLILLSLLIVNKAYSQQVTVKGSELKYRTSSGVIATAANKDSLNNKTNAIQTALDGKFNTPTGLTTNNLTKWNGTTFVNSLVSDNGTNVSVTNDATINGLTVGRGASNVSSNTAVGLNSLYSNTTGINNTASGGYSLYSNTTGINNTASGVTALNSNTTGSNNTASGVNSLYYNTTGSNNTASGVNSLFLNTTGGNNTASGKDAGIYINSGADLTIANNSIFLGFDTRANANDETNQTVIGYNARGLGSNTTVLGNSSVVTTGIWGDIRLMKGMAIAPASATAPGTVGEIRITATHIFFCPATNTWVRSALTTW